MKTAIWCTPHAWQAASQVGAHHLSRRLSERDWRVLFLSNPVSPLHLVGWRNSEIRTRLRAARRGMTTETPNLVSLVPLTLLPFAGRAAAASPWMLANWPHWIFPDLLAALRDRGFTSPDLLVIDGPVGAPLHQLIRPKRSVLRILDRLTGFDRHQPALSAAETALAGEVDCVTYSAADLAHHAGGLGARRILHLPNGVDSRAFSTPRAEPAAYRGLRRPRIVYIGAMAEWFDFSLVEQMAQSRPDWEIILIGPAEVAHQRLRPSANLHLLGAVAWSELPGYLHHADIGIIPFDVAGHGDLVHGINPLKLYEYAAAGLPTVSIAWREISSLRAPVTLASTRDDFIPAVEATLASPPAAGILREFAAGHDWDRTLDRLLDIVS